MPNCFCVEQGRDAALAVTDGMLRRLTRRELAGALAHEVGHLRAGDTTVMSLSDAISRIAQALSYVGMLAFLVGLPRAFDGDARLLVLSLLLVASPVVVTMLQLALSRSREFEADLAAARLTGDPEGTASALETLEWSGGRIWERILVGGNADPAPTPAPVDGRTHTTAARAGSPRADRWLAVGRQVPPAGYPHVQGAAAPLPRRPLVTIRSPQHGGTYISQWGSAVSARDLRGSPTAPRGARPGDASSRGPARCSAGGSRPA